MKFKVGDKVKFIGEVENHYAKLEESLIADIKKYNNVFTIAYIHDDYVRFKENWYWCMRFNEIELISKRQFTKSDLKDGDLVTYRDGKKRTIIAESVIDECGHAVAGLGTYDNELKSILFATDLDIVKVERPAKYETVFERKEILDEVEKKYLANVIKPFRHEIKIISKRSRLGNSSICYIKIWLKNNDTANLPDFKENSMYKGMEPNREYSLKELGLE